MTNVCQCVNGLKSQSIPVLETGSIARRRSAAREIRACHVFATEWHTAMAASSPSSSLL